MLDAVSGSAGGEVVARGRSGLASRAKPTYRYPKIAAVEAGNARLSAANAAWNAMSVEQAESWNRYAEGLPLRTGFDGTRYRTTGKAVLVALSTKLLQIDPSAALPLDPPKGRGALPLPEIGMAAGPQGLTLTAGKGVPEGCLVEILLQRLPNGKRKPVRFYKSAGFAAFPEAGWTVTIETGPGWVAVEAGIVEASSGRTGLRTPLGKVEVVGGTAD